MKKAFSLLALIVTSTALLLAADVDGKWSATQTFGDRTIESTMTFKADGTKLTGTVSGRRGDTEIQDGKIEGDNISFTVKRQTQKGDFTSNYKGKVMGDEIKFTMSMGDRNSEFTAKRVK
ncbi:MAG TPA: hypothetical protein VFB63_34690 [Bryobacteraceae bacterium]|jgi:hypothetical protein|nr:hypothetical protein [Bryobacteraceae bacterium]